MPLRGEGSDRGPVLRSFKNRRGAEFFCSPAVLRQNAESAVFPAHAPGAAAVPPGDTEAQKRAGGGCEGQKARRWGNTEVEKCAGSGPQRSKSVPARWAGAVRRQPEDWFIFMNVSVRWPSRPFAEPLYRRENVVPEGAATKKAAAPFAVEPLAAVAKYTLTPRFGVPL